MAYSWEELTIEALSIPVRIYLHAREMGEASSYRQLKRLVKVAFDRELKRLGYSDEEIMAEMGCSRATLTRCRSTSFGTEAEFDRGMQALLALLRSRPHSQDELTEAVIEDVCGKMKEGEAQRVDIYRRERLRDFVLNTTSALLNSGVITLEEKGLYRWKSPRGRQGTGISPRADRRYFAARRLMELSATVGSFQRGRAARFIRRIRPHWSKAAALEAVDGALEDLLTCGALVQEDGSDVLQVVSSPSTAAMPRRSGDFSQASRLGAPELYRAVAEFTTLLLGAEPDAAVRELCTQRVMTYDASVGDQRQFVSKFSTHTRDSIFEIDERSEACPPLYTERRPGSKLSQSERWRSVREPGAQGRRLRACAAWVSFPLVDEHGAD